jgi:carboxylesterase type B
VSPDAGDPVVVETPSGAVRGRVHADGDVVEFLGLRYARAERFAAPGPEPAWDGVRDAGTPAPQCPPLPSRMDDVAGPSDAEELGQDEDCLRLTVRAPPRRGRELAGAGAHQAEPELAATGTTASTYRFTWRAPGNPIGACHTIELPFLFGNREAWQDAPMLAGASWDDDVEPLGRALRRWWLRFARERDWSSERPHPFTWRGAPPGTAPRSRA